MKKLRSFLRLVDYYREFLPKMAEIATPKSCREEVLRLVHNSTYAGVRRNYEDLRNRFFWRGMFLDSQDFCKSCLVCLKNKRSYERK